MIKEVFCWQCGKPMTMGCVIGGDRKNRVFSFGCDHNEIRITVEVGSIE